MQTQKNLVALGLASAGALAPAALSQAAQPAVNGITEVTVTAEAKATRIVIVGSQAFTPEVKSLGKSGVTTITLPGLWQAGPAGTKSIQRNGVAFVRYGQYAMRPTQQVRIVANYNSTLRENLRYVLSPSADKTRWEVVLHAPETVASAASARRVLPPSPQAPIVLFAAQPTVRGSQRYLGTQTVRAGMRLASRSSDAPLSRAGAASYSLLTASQVSLCALLPESLKVTEEAPTHTLPQLDRSVTLTQALNNPVPRARTAERPATKAVALGRVLEKPAVATPAPVQENPLDRIVSLEFVNADLGDVAKLISTQAQVNFVAGQSTIGKKVTLSLTKVLLREALDWITRTSGIAYTLEGTSTIILGSGQEIALLKRTNQTPDALSANIPFFYADPDSLKTALTAAFPNVTLHIIRASEESKKADDGSGSSATVPTPTGERVQIGGTINQGATPASIGTIKPRGGSLYVVGTRAIVEEIRTTIEEMEKGLIEIAQRDADRKSEQMRSYVNDVYEVRYVDPTQAARLVRESVPNVIIRPGPAQRFIATPLGIGGALAQPGGQQGGGGFGGVGAGQANAAQQAVGGAQQGLGGGVQQGLGGGQPGLGGGQGGVSLVESRILLITGKAQDVTLAKSMLGQLDVKVPQFVYEARLVEVNKDNLDQLGLRYDMGRVVNVGESNPTGTPTVGPLIGTAPTGAPGRDLGVGGIYRTAYSVAAQIDALATRGKANILARPTLSALDGNPAVTFIGDQVPYVISQQQTPTGLNIQTGVASAGIRLQVSGRSNGDGSMTVYVHPEISTISQFVGGLPQISSRFVDTTIRVKNGETIAIGGLVRRQDIENMRKVPGLGDLPILGQLFRTSDKRTSETEVLIFITCSLAKD